MNYTENLALNLWDPDDKVLRTDFNADNAKLDAAIKALENKADMKANQLALTNEITARANGDSNLNTRVNAVNTALAKKGNCEIYYMSYVGDGQDTKTLTFPKKPLMVHIMGSSATFHYLAGLKSAISGSYGGTGNICPVTWEGNSMTWQLSSGYEHSFLCNNHGETYYVVALMDAGE